jgi:O-antigen/teichoic acid export membrane protein
MSERRNLVSSALVYTFTNALGAAIPFLMMPLLTRVLAPADYGRVAMFSVLVTILGTLTGLNVHGAVGMRYLARDQVDFPRYVASCVVILGVSAVVVTSLVLVLSRPIESITSLPRWWLVAAVLVSSGQFVIQLQLVIWQYVKSPWKHGSLRVAQALLDAGLSVALVLIFGLAWRGRVVGIGVATALAAAFCLAYLIRSPWIRFPASREYVRDALRFGVPLVPHVIGGMLIALIDRFLVSSLLDLSSTGVYMVAVQIGAVLGLATDSFNRAYVPWLLESLNRGGVVKEKRIVRFTYGYFIGVSITALMMGLVAQSVLGVVVGEKYRSAGPLVSYVCQGFAFGGMYYMLAPYVFQRGRTASLAAVTLTCGLLNVPICYMLIKLNGLVGAAQSFMIAQAMLFAGTWILANKSRPMPWLRALLPAESV